jgi:hypothetical protein
VPPCEFSASTENVLDAYEEILASRLNAEIQVIAWSGKGAVRNANGSNPTSPDPLPFYYNRTLATSVNDYWVPSKYIPDVVIIMLGTYNYNTSLTIVQ